MILGPAMYWPHIQPASEPTRHATVPKMMVAPISAPTRAAAASGPGVGGTMAWVSCSDPTSPIDMTLTVTPIILAAECTSGFRMT